MPIQILAADVADKIAAGEVVERPASVVKELVENSLDAGATEIQVEIRDGGRRLIRVSDNGFGILAAEAPLAVQRHATSKLSSTADLDHISTLGFRGEALAAIAAVSKTTLVTRFHTDATGTELRLEGSDILGIKPVGAPMGTSISVEQLFWNVPARLKFLKTDATEAGHVSQLVTRYALAYPEVRFTALNDGRISFQSPGKGDRAAVLLKVFGADIARQMLAFESSNDQVTPNIGISGFVSPPALHRANRTYVELFVNRRYIQDRNLTFAVIQAYHTLLPEKRFPIALIFIDIPPKEVDVNVHPSKAEVRFRQPSLIFRAVQRGVHRTLVDSAPIASLQPASPMSTTDWAERRQRLLQAGQDDGAEPGQLAMGLYRSSLGDDDASQVGQSPAGTSDEAGVLPALRPVGQIAAMYLVAEGPGGLYLIDQHAAHERILYEQIVGADKEPVATQALLEPIVIEIGTRLAGLVSDNLESLRQSGFDLEAFGSDSFLLRGVPAAMGRQDPRRLLEEVAESMGENDDLVGVDREEALVRIICKRLAIKAGQVLSLAEQRELIRQLEQTSNPRTCPHGRPTILHFSAAQLERQFGRVQ
ncbi:MAG: DNA mismatch repair endonuclease MutL [Caldilineales bacterium]|nr:DNA mismatch repair endonuclease MutL [Caldilineales bacterium]